MNLAAYPGDTLMLAFYPVLSRVILLITQQMTHPKYFCTFVLGEHMACLCVVLYS